MQDNISSGQYAQFDIEKKSAGIAYALWFFLGVLGGHRFYTKDIGIAIAMFFTLGGLGLWTLIDVFFIGARVRKLNEETRQRIFNGN